MLDLLASSPSLFLSCVFVVSLLVGSFLNVVIYRLPIMMERNWKAEYQAYFATNTAEKPIERFDLIKPDSTCPACNHRIRAWENIPVVSWLWLKGRCSQCASTISLRYPLIELLTAVLSVWVALHFGYGLQSLAAILLTWCVIVLTFIDLDTMLLPDDITLPLLWLGLLLSLADLYVSPTDAILGAIFGYLSLWAVYWCFKLLTGKEGMGHGDFKLLAALGAWLGWQALPIVILISSFVGAIVGISLILLKKNQLGQAIPYGPYLALAGWMTLLYADNIQQSYFNWLGL
jgi:leader peptidase (prepilin peptidase)/N-methyltransferase